MKKKTVILLRIEDKGLGLLFNDVLIGSVVSATDHHDSWFMLEKVAENLATMFKVPLEQSRFSEEVLGQDWNWDDVVKAQFKRESIIPF